MRVFVVEDDAATRRFVTWLLTMRTRHEVSAFASAEEALDELRRLCPGVLLTDLCLPGLSGEALALAVARLPVPPRVVLMSGDTSRLEKARPICHGFLVKPFSISDLLKLFEPSQPEPEER
jgi:FixJ family two-component response regulator